MPWQNRASSIYPGSCATVTATLHITHLVLADQWCNIDKRDVLPGPPHVTVWADRNQRHGVTLADLAPAQPRSSLPWPRWPQGH